MWRAEAGALTGDNDETEAVVTLDGVDADDPDVPARSRARRGDRLAALIENATTVRRQAAGLGGRSTLLHFADGTDAGIEITLAHPSSLTPFITGRSTLLSNLFRDGVAHRNARLAAERITTKNVELRTARGIEAVHLAVGLAQWTHAGESYTGPLLLRPLLIRRHHADFELKLHGDFSLNSELALAFSTQFGIELDGDALVSLAYEGGVFSPLPIVEEVRNRVASTVPDFTASPRLIVSTFADVGGAMARDTESLDHPVLNAIGGDKVAREVIATASAPVLADSMEERFPAADMLLLDADTEQEAVLARIRNAESLVVQTLPGTGGTQTVINAVGELVREGKRVLVVSARRSTLDGVRYRLSSIGLPGLAVSPRSVRSDLIRAIGRNEKAERPDVTEVDDALIRLRGVLKEYRHALTSVDRKLGISALDATRQLAALGEARPQPASTARLDLPVLTDLKERREEAAELMRTAARLGEFRFGPDDSPWYGVAFTSVEQAHDAHALATELHTTEVGAVLERGYELIARTKIRPFQTLDELGEDLGLLTGIRDSLDKFSPTVFERPIDDMIDAHAPRREAPAMSGANRRRFRRLVHEYVRPGVHVQDMYAALLRIQHQRLLWEELVDSDTAPEIPVGVADAYDAWERLDHRLSELDEILGRSGADRLGALPLEKLLRVLASLAGESEYFDNVIERAEVRTQLGELGLGGLLTELSVRHVPEEQVGNELEFVWWQSALEYLLRNDRALLGANTSVVDRLERDFRLVDRAHAEASGPLLAADLATKWKIGIVDEPDEAERLKDALKSGVDTTGELADAAPTLIRTLAPVWLASPYDVPKIPDWFGFDAVIIADAGSLSVAEAAPALRRSGQVVVFGDPVTQRPTPFAVAAGHRGDEEDTAALPELRSVLEQLADFVNVATLTRSYRAGGEDLAELVNDAYYGGEIVSLPWAGSYLGRGSLSVDYVRGGTGMPDPVTGAVESPDAEVQRVVTLVTEHAVNRAKESLMVITASARHAERVRAAVDAAFAGRSDVADFVSRDTSEPFAVLTLEESVAESRDRVVFSLGYGLTRHGRVLSDFGDLSTADGERLLTVGMTRARRSMVIVSSIHPDSVEDGRLHHGAATLMSILAGIETKPREARREDDADPLTVVLARALRRWGVSVDVNYRGLLPLVAQYRGSAVVADPDPETRAETLRESLRLRPQILRRLGWHYVRVHAFDLYADADAVAAKIAHLLGVGEEAQQVEGDTVPLDVSS